MPPPSSENTTKPTGTINADKPQFETSKPGPNRIAKIAKNIYVVSAKAPENHYFLTLERLTQT
jgi:hypothetical protein